MCFQALSLRLINGLGGLLADVLKVVGAVMQVRLATYDGGRRSEATTAVALTVPVAAVSRLFAPEEARGHGGG